MITQSNLAILLIYDLQYKINIIIFFESFHFLKLRNKIGNHFLSSAKL